MGAVRALSACITKIIKIETTGKSAKFDTAKVKSSSYYITVCIVYTK